MLCSSLRIYLPKLTEPASVFEKIAPRTYEKSPVDISKEPCRHVKRALRVLKQSTKHKHKEPHTCEHPTRVEYEA